MAGIGVDIIDPGEAIARELRRRLENIGQLSRRDRLGTEQFWTSGSPESSKTLISQLWETDVEVNRLPEV